MMQIPAELKYLGGCFHQGSAEEASTMQEWVMGALELLTPQQRRSVKSFVGELLSGGCNDQELLELWDALGSDYFLSEASARELFSLIRNAA